MNGHANIKFIIHSQSYHISASQTLLRNTYRISHTLQRTYNLARRLDASPSSWQCITNSLDMTSTGSLTKSSWFGAHPTGLR